MLMIRGLFKLHFKLLQQVFKHMMLFVLVSFGASVCVPFASVPIRGSDSRRLRFAKMTKRKSILTEEVLSWANRNKL